MFLIYLALVLDGLWNLHVGKIDWAILMLVLVIGLKINAIAKDVREIKEAMTNE
jgi:hypothetical protein